MTFRGSIKDLLVLSGLALAGAWGSLVLNADFFVSTLLFYVPPVLYLAAHQRAHEQAARLFTMFLVFGLLYGFLFAYIANVGDAWSWPHSENFLQNALLLGAVPVTDVLWVSLWVLYIVLFYEHFFERDRDQRIAKRVWYALVSGVAVFGAIFVSAHYAPWLFDWPYAYAILSVLTLPPCIVLLYRAPRVVLKILVPALFFIPLHLLIEVVGLHLGHWEFAGEYFAIIHLFEGYAVPVEEFLTWIVLGSFITLAYYELYTDDMH